MTAFIPQDPIAPAAERIGHRVYMKTAWTANWVRRRNFFADAVSWSCAPSLGQATLTEYFGEVKLFDELTPRNFTRIDRLRYFVRIDFDDAIPTWYGVIEEQANEMRKTPSGTRTLAALSLESLLKRTRVDKSFVEAPELGDDSYRIVARGLTFNDPALRDGREPVPNRSLLRGPHGVYVFSPDLDNATYWRTFDILQYLLRYFSPNSTRLDQFPGLYYRNVPFGLHPDSDQAGVLGDDAFLHDRPVLRTEGLDTHRLLCELLDRRRMFGWCFHGVDDERQTEAGSLAEIFAFRPTADVVELSDDGGAFVLPANHAKRIERFKVAVDVPFHTIRESAANQYDVIVARGAPIRFLATSFLDAPNSWLIKDWTDADETAYDDGASNLPSYAGLGRDEQERENYRVRTDQALAHVYSRFAFSPLTGPSPIVTLAGQQVALYPPALRILPRTFLVDAYGDPRPPFGVIAADADEPDKYKYLDALDDAVELVPHGPTFGRNWSVALRALDDRPGLEVKVRGGPQHYFAKNHSTPVTITADDAPDLDYEEALITYAFELDNVVEYRQVVSADSARDAVRELLIDVGEAARLDWIAPQTVLAIDAAGQLVTQGTVGAFLNDSRPRLRAAAKAAAQWYARKRRAVSLTVSSLANELRTGDFLLQLGDEEINSVVTTVRYDVVRQQTAIETDYAEFDGTVLFSNTPEVA